jgi:hypothetical protein
LSDNRNDNEFLNKEIIAGIGLRNQGEYVRDGSESQPSFEDRENSPIYFLPQNAQK